jgi:hypothetical protein
MGFSQCMQIKFNHIIQPTNFSLPAYYIIFLTYETPAANPLPNPIESIMAMFLMSLTSFGDYYPQFEKTMHDSGSKVMQLKFPRNPKQSKNK